MNKIEQYQWLLFSLQPLDKKRLKDWEKEAKEELAQLGVNILAIDEIDNQLRHYQSCYTIEVDVVDDGAARQILSGLGETLKCDFCVIKSSFKLPKVGLAVFDMDSTLIPMEVIDELAKEAGVASEVSTITELAMLGELDFNQSFERRLALLKGMPQDAVEKVLERIQFNAGVESFLNWLISQGADIAIASGGFDVFAQALSKRVAFNEVNSNRLRFEQGRLTGEAQHPIVNAKVKSESLSMWRQQRNLKKEETIAVGDGANDLMMLQEAGLGVAYKAKPFLRDKADCVLQYAEMDALSDILSSIVRKEKSPS